jgi:outer membrane protein
MKKQFLFLSIAFLLTSTILQAQTERKSWMVGGQFNQQLSFSDGTNYYVFNLSPDAGFFISNNLALGAAFSTTIFVIEGETDTRIGLAPFVRYYFGGSEKVKLFVHGQAGFEVDDSDVSFVGKAHFGVAWFVVKNVALEASAGYSIDTRGEADALSTLGMNVGFQVYF